MDSRKKLQTRKRKRKNRAFEKECVYDINTVLKKIRLDTCEQIADAQVVRNLQGSVTEDFGTNLDGVCNEEVQEDIQYSDDPVDFYNELLVADLQGDLQADDFHDPPVEAEHTEIEEIRTWAIETNLNCSALDKLLKILRKKLLPDLPKSSKTFLKTTSAEYDISQMADSSPDEIPGEFVYFGIATGLGLCINTDLHESEIELIINIDGLPLTKSGGKCFWPILCKVHHIPDMYKPFIVAIYCGDSKPKNLSQYLEKFINELNYLHTNGITLCHKQYTIRVKCFVADTPARSYLKCVKGHGGYSACERCTVYGMRVKNGKGSSVVYPSSNDQLRTNISFRNRDDPEHHTAGVSPLEDITPEIDMPNIFVLDFMHLGAGVTKKILEMLMYGPLTVRLSRRQKIEVSRRLRCIKLQLPSEFQRKPRSIFYVRQWKATEFRFFLLYGGPVVLKNVIGNNLYKHFLLLHVAFRILCSDHLAIPLNAFASKCLEKFVLALPLLYGPAAQVINMHNLIHVADDALNLGCSLSRINSFPFESALGAIKRTLRTAVNPLAQVCRREHEQRSLRSDKVNLPKELKIHKSQISNGNLMIESLTMNFSTFFTTKAPNNVVLLKNGYVMRIETLNGRGAALASISISGPIWKSKDVCYSYPRKSDHFETWEIRSAPCQRSITCPLSHVERKLILMKLPLKPQGRSRLFAMSLLHT